MHGHGKARCLHPPSSGNQCLGLHQRVVHQPRHRPMHDGVHQSGGTDHRCVRGGSGRHQRCAYWVSSAKRPTHLAPQRAHPRTADQHQRHQRTSTMCSLEPGMNSIRREPPSIRATLVRCMSCPQKIEPRTNVDSKRVEGAQNYRTKFRFTDMKSAPMYIHSLGRALGDLVHPQKGCYVGQEVLVRMRSRGKLGRRLVRTSIRRPKPPRWEGTKALLLERIQ